MKKLLSLILSITMLTSVAQLSAFADITAPVGTTEDNPVSVESSLQDETENVAEVSQDEPVLNSTLEQESAKLIKLTAEETGFKLTDSSDSQSTATAEQAETETEPTTDDDCDEEEHNHSLPEGIINGNGNMLKGAVSTNGGGGTVMGTSFEGSVEHIKSLPATNAQFKNYYGDYVAFSGMYRQDKSFIMPGMFKTVSKNNTDAANVYRDCGQMVPQGFCFADVPKADGTKHHYMLVSAYCYKTSCTYTINNNNLTSTPSGHRHRSVVYILDRDATNKADAYITEIILPSYGHVGGIAYDPNSGWLWVGENYTPSGSSADGTLKGYMFAIDFNALVSEIESDRNIRLTTKTSNELKYSDCTVRFRKSAIVVDNKVATRNDLIVPPDALTYYDGALYIARFSYENKTYTCAGKKIASGNSLIAKYTIDSTTHKLSENYSQLITTNCDRIQGMQFVKRADNSIRLVVSRSYGRNGFSKVDVLKPTSTTKYNTYKSFSMPPMSEGIVYDEANKGFYVTFESSAYEYLGGNDKKNYCKNPCDRIAFMDYDKEDFDYDEIISIGAHDGTTNNPDPYEQIILSQAHTYTAGSVVHPGYKIYNNTSDPSLNCYIYNSKVDAGEKWLVKIQGDFDIAKKALSPNAGSTAAQSRETNGFYVPNGSSLTIRNDADKEVDIRRNTFKAGSESGKFSSYGGTFIKVQEGGKLIIDGSKNKIKITGGNRDENDTNSNGFVGAEEPIICSEDIKKSNDNRQDWYIDGLILDMLQGVTRADKTVFCNPGINAYAAFSNLTIKNCEISNVALRKDKNDTYREGAAIFISKSFECKSGTVTIDNLTYNNNVQNFNIPTNVTASNAKAVLPSFDAIRVEGIADTFNLTNSTFENSYSLNGPVGFVSYNQEGSTRCTEQYINNLNIDKLTFKNCNGVGETEPLVKREENASNTTLSIPHYFGPLTFGSTVNTKLSVNNVTFSNCSAYSSGGIAFDRDANITKAVLGSENQNDTNNRKALVFDSCIGKKNAGAIGIYGKINQLIVGDATINGCKSTNGSAIMIYGSTKDNVKAEIADMKLQYTDIRNCFSKDEYNVGGNNYSGTVRSTGSAACKLTVDHCNITDNYVWKDGGGIYWNAMGKTTNNTKSSLYIKDSVISNNTAAESGGGIYCEADITGPNDSSTKTDPGIVRTVISGNKARKDGGGICQTVYDNSSETSVVLSKTKLALGEKVEINNNLAKGDGGGVAFILRDSANIKDVNAASNYSLTFEISDKGENSAVISNNQAEFYGGGIYYGTGSEITTNDGALDATAQDKINNYTKSINLYAGKINNNKANSHGGGIYSNSGAIMFKKGEIDNNEAGADVTVPSVAVDGTISEKSLTNGNGGGGAVFVINGGSVTVYNGFIRNNKAFKHNSDDKNTAFQGNTYDGVGGGICVANGAGATDDKRSKFTLTKETADQVYNVGIYSNEADFAADDVYASGKYTKLDVPKVGVMNLTDYKGKATGWFEDYNNGDTKYAQYGTSLAEETEDVGSRYRRNIQKYPSKYKIPDVSSDPKGDMITNFVNTNDNYVCMTLGAIASTSITNNIKVPDLDNLGTYKSVSGTPHDVALKYTITRNDGDFTANDLVFDIDGKKFDPDIPTHGNTFSFYLKDGETINFPNMSDDIKISVKVEYVKSINGETIYTTGKNISYVAKTNNKVVTDGTDGETSADTTSEIITTDGNKIQTFTFDNVLVAVRVKINFFDRNTDKSGTPADIKSNATTYNKDYIGSDCEQFFSGSTSEPSPIKKMITATGVKVEDKYKNVVDDYHLWTSQTDAENGIKKFATEESEYKNLVSKKYSDENNYKFHSNNYGIPTTENWLTYTTVEGDVKSYEQAKTLETNTANIVNASKEIGQVNVWLFNTPKKYSVKVYEAPENSNKDNMTVLENGKFIFNGTVSKTFNAYYNQRIGTETGDTPQDENTNHLKNYGLSGIIKDSSNNPVVLNTAKEIKVGNDTYKFSYWSFDENGKTVASTNYGYNYRITTDTDLYPVYEKTPMRLNRDNVGVTTTANQIDVFFDDKGVAKTRLNTVINPYNCDDNDSRISHVSAIYIIASKNATVDKSVIDGLKKIIHKYYTDNSVTSSGSMDISTLINNDSTLKIKDENGKEVTIKKGMYYVYTKDAANLTNKNRTEFTLTFDTSALLNRRLLAFTAMKFNNDWKVSDNCYDYSFDEKGAMNEVKNITSVY